MTRDNSSPESITLVRIGERNAPFGPKTQQYQLASLAKEYDLEKAFDHGLGGGGLLPTFIRVETFGGSNIILERYSFVTPHDLSDRVFGIGSYQTQSLSWEVESDAVDICQRVLHNSSGYELAPEEEVAPA